MFKVAYCQETTDKGTFKKINFVCVIISNSRVGEISSWGTSFRGGGFD